MFRFLAGVLVFLSVSQSAIAQEHPLPVSDIDAFGGVIFMPWSARDSIDGHTIMVSIRSLARVRDVDYAFVESSDGKQAAIDSGNFPNLRQGDYEILTSQAHLVGNNAEILACASYFNIEDQQHYASINRFAEPQILANGQANFVAGPSRETIVPIRFRHDGHWTCELLLKPDTFAALLAAQQTPPIEMTGSEIERSENPENANTIVMSSWLVAKSLHALEGYITPETDIADVHYSVRIVDPVDAPQARSWSGDLAFVTGQTGFDFTLASSDGNEGKRLPLQTVVFSTCLAYLDVAGRRYARETWQGRADYDRVVKFQDTTLPQKIFPEGDILVEYAANPFDCADNR